MPPLSLQLEDLLRPIAPETFFRDSWEKSPAIIARGAEGHYAGLFSLRDLDQLIAFSRPKFADRSGFESAPPTRPTYVRGLLADQPLMTPVANPGIADLRRVYDQGQSVVLMGLQQRWPSVARLCRNLEAEFHCPVHANLYLTPPGSQGFAAHYDPHDVFILQLEGVKHWRLFDRTELLPLATDKVVPPAPPLGAARDVRLQPGDLLYLPRGHVHDAHTNDKFSLHLTIGINVYRWADLLHHAVLCASRKESRFRESIPGGALPVGTALLKQQFQHLLALLSDGAQDGDLFDAAAGSLADQFYRQLPMLPGTQFSSDVDLEAVDLETVLENQGQAMCRVLENDEGVAIEFPGNRVTGPQRIAAALRFIAAHERFTVRELPDDLNAQGKVVLARRLVREGLLTLAAPSPETCSRDEQMAWESRHDELTVEVES